MRGLAVAAGLLLAALPFLLYGTSTHDHTAHTDHAPRHGGELFMVGDHHLEVVRAENRIELFVSDGSRRPQRSAEGQVELSDGARTAMRWYRGRLVADVESGSSARRFSVTLPDGVQIELRMP